MRHFCLSSVTIQRDLIPSAGILPSKIANRSRLKIIETETRRHGRAEKGEAVRSRFESRSLPDAAGNDNPRPGPGAQLGTWMENMSRSVGEEVELAHRIAKVEVKHFCRPEAGAWPRKCRG